MRLQLLSQQTQWARRHIADTSDVSRLFLRTGTIFVAITVIGASSLTAVATVEAQKVDLGALERPVKELGDEIARVLNLVGVRVEPDLPPTRGDTSPLGETWVEEDGVAFTAAVTGGLRDNYWWGWADDEYDVEARLWRTTTSSVTLAPSGTDVSAPSDATAGGDHELDVTITLGAAGAAWAQAFRPAEAVVFTRHDVNVRTVDDGDTVGDITYDRALAVGEGVRVIAQVRDYSGDDAFLTADDLRGAGDAYPPWTDKYRQGAADPRIAGERVRRMASRIMAAEANAYDQALAVQNELRQMDYVTDIQGVCDPYSSVPECLLAEEVGFCQQYATTMAVVLRAMGIPSRFVTGYLPGERDPEAGVWTVRQAALHNWVEAYFPDYGWVRFDPTPGRAFGQTPTALLIEEDGGPEPTDPPGPAITEPPFDEATPDPAEEVVLGPDDGGGDDPTVLVVSGGALLALILAVGSMLLLFRLRRLPGGDDGLAYRGIVSLATRLGYGPHPSQTEYEYAATLSDVMPAVRNDLYVVAGAQVETAYGRRHLGPERRGLLSQAYARIRTALLRLSLRRRS
jgi:transglutaminase-like putative cysteine protease